MRLTHSNLDIVISGTHIKKVAHQLFNNFLATITTKWINNYLRWHAGTSFLIHPSLFIYLESWTRTSMVWICDFFGVGLIYDIHTELWCSLPYQSRVKLPTINYKGSECTSLVEKSYYLQKNLSCYFFFSYKLFRPRFCYYWLLLLLLITFVTMHRTETHYRK